MQEFWCVSREIWLKMVTMGEQDDAEMGNCNSKIMINQRPKNDLT